MFREAFERGAEIGAGPVARLWRQALLLASRNWQLESLYRSNAKYQPTWQPRFICFEYASDLPRVGTAAGSAEGFLTKPVAVDAAPARRRGRRGARTARAPSTPQRSRRRSPRSPISSPRRMSAERLPEQQRVRRAKLDRLRAQGIDPYPVTLPAHPHAGARSGPRPATSRPTPRTGRTVSVVGRVMRKRDGGKLGFATLRDGSGDLQVMVGADDVGAESLELWQHDVDLGDHLGVTGEVITTQARRAVRPGRVAALDQQVAAAAARQAQGPHRPRGPGPRSATST